MEIQRKFIGLNGALFVLLNQSGMGFWGFQKFNNAMLTKQVWCLIHAKGTLLYKVFSAKYFLSILEAPIHPKCSYTWSNILQAQEVINKGAIWRVGNNEWSRDGELGSGKIGKLLFSLGSRDGGEDTCEWRLGWGNFDLAFNSRWLI